MQLEDTDILGSKSVRCQRSELPDQVSNPEKDVYCLGYYDQTSNTAVAVLATKLKKPF